MPTWWEKVWGIDSTIPPPKVSADYNYNIDTASKPTGPVFDRSLDLKTIDVMASEPASQFGSLAKTIQYGNVASSTFDPSVNSVSSSPFTYAQGLVGGKKKSTKKSSKSKTSTTKSKTSTTKKSKK